MRNMGQARKVERYTGMKNEGCEMTSVTVWTQRTGKTEAEIMDCLRRAAAYEADQVTLECMRAPYFQREEDLQEKQRIYLEHMVARFHTIEEGNLQIEKLPMRCEEQGELQAIVPVHVLADAGISYRTLSLKKNPLDKKLDFSYMDTVFVTYSSGQLHIRIEETEWAKAAFANARIEFGREYPIFGIYKDYVEGTMLALKGGAYVIPVFAADDHTIAYLDIYECAKGGAFCLTEMACVSEMPQDNWQVVMADLEVFIFARYKGFAQSAMQLADEEGFGMECKLLQADGTINEACYYFGFDMEDGGKLRYQGVDALGNVVLYEGNCTYLGMTEQGILFSYSLENLEERLHLQGIFQTARVQIWDEEIEDFRVFMKYKTISGDALFPTLDKSLELTVSFG